MNKLMPLLFSVPLLLSYEIASAAPGERITCKSEVFNESPSSHYDLCPAFDTNKVSIKIDNSEGDYPNPWTKISGNFTHEFRYSGCYQSTNVETGTITGSSMFDSRMSGKLYLNFYSNALPGQVYSSVTINKSRTAGTLFFRNQTSVELKCTSSEN